MKFIEKIKDLWIDIRYRKFLDTYGEECKSIIKNMIKDGDKERLKEMIRQSMELAKDENPVTSLKLYKESDMWTDDKMYPNFIQLMYQCKQYNLPYNLAYSLLYITWNRMNLSLRYINLFGEIGIINLDLLKNKYPENIIYVTSKNRDSAIELVTRKSEFLHQLLNNEFLYQLYIDSVSDSYYEQLETIIGGKPNFLARIYDSLYELSINTGNNWFGYDVQFSFYNRSFAIPRNNRIYSFFYHIFMDLNTFFITDLLDREKNKYLYFSRKWCTEKEQNYIVSKIFKLLYKFNQRADWVYTLSDIHQYLEVYNGDFCLSISNCIDIKLLAHMVLDIISIQAIGGFDDIYDEEDGITYETLLYKNYEIVKWTATLADYLVEYNHYRNGTGHFMKTTEILEKVKDDKTQYPRLKNVILNLSNKIEEL